MTLDTAHYKAMLHEELGTLEEELSSIGEHNPENKADWQAKPADFEANPIDEIEQADAFEEFEANTAILKQLEIRYNDVKKALKRIDDGSYGVCEIEGETIEEDRLEANPAARTCILHKEQEAELRETE
jgi:RNA polymerase-binding transcription factor DksA